MTTTEVLATEILIPEIAKLRGRYPQLQVEIVTGIRLLDIARRAADIAMRPVRSTSPKLIADASANSAARSMPRARVSRVMAPPRVW